MLSNLESAKCLKNDRNYSSVTKALREYSLIAHRVIKIGLFMRVKNTGNLTEKILPICRSSDSGKFVILFLKKRGTNYVSFMICRAIRFLYTALQKELLIRL